MSEYDDIDRRAEESQPEARVHVPKWSPWVWVVPALAIFFVGYLVVRYGFFGGGDVTVRFAEARGLDRYSPVRFRGAKVGSVQKITVDEGKGQVIVRLSIDASMKNALRKGTRFWIEEPGLETGGLGGLLSGTSVGIAPGPGEPTSEFLGQEYAPVLAPPEVGRTVVLESARLGAVPVGTPLQFHGMRVGRVLGSEYDVQHGLTLVHVFIVQRFAGQIRQGTRFYRVGGLDVSLSGGGLSLGGLSLASLLASPLSFTTPEVLPGAPVADGTRFELYESESAADAASDGAQLTYMAYFTGPVQGLAPGTPVRMRGVQVGRVRDVRLRYVPQTASLETPVTFEIDPTKLEFPVTDTTTREELRAQMNDALAKLVRKGMRASLATSLVLPGASGVSLDMTGARNSATLDLSHDPPIVPAAGGGSGLEGALSAVNDVAARIRAIPIEEIAGNLRSTSQRLNTLVQDPRLDASVKNLDAALSDLQRSAALIRQNAGPITEDLRKASGDAAATAAVAKANVEPIVRSLRTAAASAESAAGRADQLIGSSPRQGYDLGALVKELTRAAESVRALADYLEENPDALLKGRGK